MYSELDGKVALVTGAGRAGGLGAAIAHRLAAEGAHVVVHDLGETAKDKDGVGGLDEMNQVVDEIRQAGGTASACAADVRSEHEVEALVGHAVSQYGKLDILVNNAGVGFLFAPILETSADAWNMTLDVNLRGCFFGLKHAALQMKKQGASGDWGAGRIISIASVAAKSGTPLTGAYTASKHGLIGLTRTAALELGQHGINVNAVCPNHVTTGLGEWQNEYMAKKQGLSVPDYLENMKKRIPLGRVGMVDDTAKACAFLCSDQATYITGEAMNVSGGQEYH